jgi:hypothetical protein
MEFAKCFLCDRKKNPAEMQSIRVNGMMNAKACAEHEIADHGSGAGFVTTFPQPLIFERPEHDE